MIGIDPIDCCWNLKEAYYTIKSNAKVRIWHSCKSIILCNIWIVWRIGHRFIEWYNAFKTTENKYIACIWIDINQINILAVKMKRVTGFPGSFFAIWFRYVGLGGVIIFVLSFEFLQLLLDCVFLVSIYHCKYSSCI